MFRRQLLALSTGALALPGILRAAPAYPDRSIRFIVPFPAGGGTDVWARLVAEAMQPLLGKPIVVENRTGAGGIVGAQAALQAPPDGYTLFYSIDAFITALITQRITPYDPLRDFAPIGRLGATTITYTVGPAVPATITTLADYVAWAQRQRNVPLGNWGAGGAAHAFAVLLEREAKLPNAQHISYRGEAPMLQDNLSGVFHGGYHSVAVNDTVRAGRLRALATGGPDRLPSLANQVPTMRELGYSERFDFAGFNGLFAPAKTPQPILDRLVDVFRQATTTPAMLEKLRVLDTIHIYEDPATFARTMEKVSRDWAKLTEELDLYQTAS